MKRGAPSVVLPRFPPLKPFSPPCFKSPTSCLSFYQFLLFPFSLSLTITRKNFPTFFHPLRFTLHSNRSYFNRHSMRLYKCSFSPFNFFFISTCQITCVNIIDVFVNSSWMRYFFIEYTLTHIALCPRPFVSWFFFFATYHFREYERRHGYAVNQREKHIGPKNKRLGSFLPSSWNEWTARIVLTATRRTTERRGTQQKWKTRRNSRRVKERQRRLGERKIHVKFFLVFTVGVALFFRRRYPLLLFRWINILRFSNRRKEYHFFPLGKYFINGKKLLVLSNFKICFYVPQKWEETTVFRTLFNSRRDSENLYVV